MYSYYTLQTLCCSDLVATSYFRTIGYYGFIGVRISAALNHLLYCNREHLSSLPSAPGMVWGTTSALTHLIFVTELLLTPLCRFGNSGTRR